MLNRIVKGAIRYNSNGELNQSADKRRLGARPETVRSRIYSVSDILHGSSVLAKDYKDVIALADIDDLIYMDPPYQGTSDTRDCRYISGLKKKDYELVLKSMVQRDLSFMVSYDAVNSEKNYGEALDSSLGLCHLQLVAGKSAQATLLGRNEVTIESLYISPALLHRLGGEEKIQQRLVAPLQADLTLF